MAKYSDKDIARLSRQDKGSLTSYERRLVRGHEKGLSRSQSRGHARTEKYNEKSVSEIKKTAKAAKPTPTKAKAAKAVKPAKPKQPPKINQRIRTFPNGGKMISGYKTDVIISQLMHLINTDPNQTQARIYFQVWNAKEGKFVSVYQGERSNAHGITVEDFLKRIEVKLQEGKSSDDAIREVLNEDSSDGAGVDSPTGEEAPADFTQFRMYVMPSHAKAA